MKKAKENESEGQNERKMAKKISTEAHELMQIILPRIDGLSVAVRDGKYDTPYALVFISYMLQDIDNFLKENGMVKKNEKKSKRRENG